MSFVIITRNGSLYRQHRGERGMHSSDPSLFATRANAEATNASTCSGTGTVAEVVHTGLYAPSAFPEARNVEGYWLV